MAFRSSGSVGYSNVAPWMVRFPWRTGGLCQPWPHHMFLVFTPCPTTWYAPRRPFATKSVLLSGICILFHSQRHRILHRRGSCSIPGKIRATSRLRASNALHCNGSKVHWSTHQRGARMEFHRTGAMPSSEESHNSDEVPTAQWLGGLPLPTAGRHGASSSVLAFNWIVDDIVSWTGQTYMCSPGGGGVQTAFGARLAGCASCVSCRVGDDFPDEHRTYMHHMGADLHTIHVSGGDPELNSLIPSPPLPCQSLFRAEGAGLRPLSSIPVIPSLDPSFSHLSLRRPNS